jgi:hypothetical protein
LEELTMAANWPTSFDTYSTKTDGVDDVLAAHINAVQDAVVALETELGTGGLKGSTASLTARLNVALNADGTVKGTALPNPIPANYVDTAALQNLAVTAAKIANATITTTQIAANTITSANILDGTIATADIANQAINSALLANNAVVTAAVADLNITAAKLEAGLRSQQDHFMDVPVAGAATVAALVQPDLALHTGSITHPSHPRTLSFSLKNISGGTLTSNTVNATLIGVDSKGAALTEVIQIPTQSINDTVTVTVPGLKAFATLTSWQLDNQQTVPASWQVSFGTGDKLGLTNLVASVYKVTKNGAHLATPAVSTANATVDFSTITGGDDFTVRYLSA